MFLVTGGAGFVGSNIIRGLNEIGIDDIVVVDNLKHSDKFVNLTDCSISDYLDKGEFREFIEKDKFPFSKVDAVFHEGACTDTMEYDGQYMMDNNYTYSKVLLEKALINKVTFVYASSAAVYGANTVFEEKLEYECPINVYGYSKFLFDQYVRRILDKAESTVVGLRYFNVYGPHEVHKGKMSSVTYQFYNQLKSTRQIKLFKGTDGVADGEQRRDFIYVSDVVRVNLFFLDNHLTKGIFNTGTGANGSFNQIARALVDLEGYGEITYTPFPASLLGKYQNYTQANISALRAAGYDKPFLSLEDGISQYHAYLEQAE
jgi:ADP-L-glycero-D-manno-heptose 6-epimerase